jgi:hypothetical protein
MVILLISTLAIATPNFTTSFRDDHYLAEGLLQISSKDMNSDGNDEILLIGRDYVDPQAILYILKAATKEPELLWKSPNIMENKSPVLLTVGKFTAGNQPQVAVVTNHWLKLFAWDATEGYRQMADIAHNLSPWEVTAGDWNQDGLDELFVTRAEKSNTQGFIKRIEVYQLQDSALKLVTTSPNLGNIRSLATGDLDGDGRDEVVIEVGKVNIPGCVTLFGTGEEGWKLKAGPLRLVKSAVFGMNVAKVKGNIVLCTASDRGKANLFRWKNGSLEQIDELSFSAGLAAITAGRFWSGKDGLAVLAYPQSFRLLTEGDIQ